MSETPPDPATENLARELYWADASTPRSRRTAADIRDELLEFAFRMRADEKLTIPLGEPNLGSASQWRRKLKHRLFRLMRPVSWRYDRLIADHAELTTALAERVQQLEAEVERLREELGRQ